MTILHFDHEGLTRHTKGTFALSPHGHMLPKIRRDARKGIVTKKFSGERLLRNNPKETIDPELQPICPQCGVEGNFVAQFEGQLIQTAKGIQVKFIHSKENNDYQRIVQKLKITWILNVIIVEEVFSSMRYFPQDEEILYIDK